MITRCPNCGAVASLDSLLAGEDAANLLVMVAALDAGVGKAALRYLGLFRPAHKDLSWGRAAKLLGELVPLMQAGEISRNRKTYPAPREAWLWAFGRALEARDAGKLQTPLTTHGWLLENITFWTPEKTACTLPVVPAGEQLPSGSPNTPPASATLQGAAAGEKYRR